MFKVDLNKRWDTPFLKCGVEHSLRHCHRRPLYAVQIALGDGCTFWQSSSSVAASDRQGDSSSVPRQGSVGEQTAKVLGLAVPPSILLRADEMIE
jgi:hypothetical protein